MASAYWSAWNTPLNFPAQQEGAVDPKFLGGAGRKKARRDAPLGEEAVIP